MAVLIVTLADGTEYEIGGTEDADAIHDNVAGEIAAIAEKTTPVSADLLVIEDSEDSNAKKRVELGNLPGGGDVTAAASLTDNAVVRGDGGAKGVQDSGVLIDDSDNVSGVGDFTLSGTVDGRDVAADGVKLDLPRHAPVLMMMGG